MDRNMTRKTSFLGLLLATTACDPRVFDEAVEKAPVRVLEKPDGWSASDFGRVITNVPLPATSPQAARIFVGSNQLNVAATFDLNGAGEANARTIGQGDLPGQVFRATHVVAPLATGNLLVGDPTFTPSGENVGRGRVHLLQVDPASGVYAQPQPLAVGETADPATKDPDVGRGVAVGALAGAAAEDYVWASGVGVTASIDDPTIGRTPRFLAASLVNAGDCTLALEGVFGTNMPPVPGVMPFVYTEAENGRGLVVADLIKEAVGAPVGEIAVGVPRSNGRSTVVLLQPTPAVPPATGTELKCVMVLSQQAAGFGFSLAAGDVNGDGNADLVVGTPPGQALVYLGPLDPLLPTAPVVLKRPDIPEGSPAGEFGWRVLVADVHPNPGAEVVVSAPRATGRNGEVDAGRVFVFDEANPTVALATVDRQTPEASMQLGISLTAVPFRSPGCTNPAIAPGQVTNLLAVGGVSKVFVYYRLPGVPTGDPRCLP